MEDQREELTNLHESMPFSNNISKFKNLNSQRSLCPRSGKLGMSRGKKKLNDGSKCFVVIVNIGIKAKSKVSEA